MIILQKNKALPQKTTPAQNAPIIHSQFAAQQLISVTGLGYVGLMIASEFAKTNAVIGFDVSTKRIDALKQGHDVNGELSATELKNCKINYTTQPDDIKQATFHIIAVPTPLDETRHPDLSILLSASEMVGKYLKKGDVVVYESSVYPGATEEKCIPVLEKASNLICGKDFGVGYSPERINPSDKEHNLGNIPKIIAATDEHTLDIMALVYNQIVRVGVYKVSSIRVAEATKVIENIQRDLNISLVNEVALILHSLDMDSVEVFKAMRTKWNYLPFRPGLVGGHCIPVNSYYLAHKAEAVGYHPEVILAGRRINEQMPKFIAESTIKQLIHQGAVIKGARIAVFGLTYKEDTPDVHDTKTIDLINELKSFDTEVLVYDPIADKPSAKKVFDIDLKSWDELTHIDAVILLVAHKEFIDMDKSKLRQIFNRKGVIMDVKGILNPEQFKGTRITIWRL